MKRLLIKSAQLFELLKLSARRLPMIILLLSFIFTGTNVFPQENKTDNRLGNKRLEILEKLESGKAISSKDISDSFRQYVYSENDQGDQYDPETQELPPFSTIPPVPGPFYYKYYDGRDHIIISDSDLEEIHNYLHRNLEDLRKNIESFRNSEDFLKMQDELRKWNDKFRKEMEKIKDELIKPERESLSKGSIHSQV